ncbi:hypothetical protein ACFWZT_14215 [Streptomyces alboflavus]|uniref:hypothetical protein n=1 Tax=Streptomyces alboflavus TaxID=67267 RepID=UPI0036C0AFAE
MTVKRAVVVSTAAMSVAVAGAGAPATADQQSVGGIRAGVNSAAQQSSASASASAAADAVCTKNQISINRFSECQWLTVHFDIDKEVAGRPALRGTVEFDVKHNDEPEREVHQLVGDVRADQGQDHR